MSPVPRPLRGQALAVALLAALLVPGAAAAAPGGAPPWDVATTPTGTTLTWRSPTPLPVGGAVPEFRVGERVLGHPAISADLRDLTLTVDGPAPDPATVEVWLSGRRLDAAPSSTSRSRVAPYRPQPAGRTLAVDPGVRGPYRTAASDYDLASVRVPDLPLPVDTIGHVVAPTGAEGARPLVVLLHGRHQSCYLPSTDQLTLEWPCPEGFQPVPSHLGYHYLQRLLASQGYVTVSVHAAAIDGQETLSAPDFGAAARAALVRRHLRLWAFWAADPGNEWHDRVDLTSVILVGHSRGGEGVARVAVTQSPTAAFDVDGLVLLAPTDFGRQAPPGVPTVTLLGYCDGDVSDLAGQQYQDVGRDIPGDQAVRSTVLALGANHNYFNTEWTPGLATAFAEDDWREPDDPVCGTDAPTRLSARAQRAFASTYVAGAVRLVAENDPKVLPMFDGSAVSVPSAGDVDMRSTAVGGRRDVVAVRRDSSVATAEQMTARICSGRSGGPAGVCGAGREAARTPHWPIGNQLPYRPGQPALGLSWAGVGGVADLRLDEPLDLTGSTSVDARVIVGTQQPFVRLGLRLTDAEGASVVLAPRRGGRLDALPGGGTLGKLLAQTLRTPLDGVSTVDLSRVTAIGLVSRTERGRVWLLDLAGRRSGLAPVAAPQVPRVRVVDVSEPEGSSRDPQEVTVPLRVAGDLGKPTRLAVRAFDPVQGLLLRRTSVVLQPGDSETSFTVPFERDDLDDFPASSSFDVAVFATNGSLLTTDYAGRMTLVDDDPAPQVTIRPVDRIVAEGADLRWRVRLSEPVDYFSSFSWRVVRARGDMRQLRSDDVPASWLRSAGVRPPERPVALWRLDLFGVAALEPGQSRAVVSIPTLADDRAEEREAVALQFRGEPQDVGERVRVARVRDDG